MGRPEDFEEEWADIQDEDSVRIKPWMIPAFAGVVVVVLLLCVVIWAFFHREQDSSNAEAIGTPKFREEEEAENTQGESQEELLEELQEESPEELQEESPEELLEDLQQESAEAGQDKSDADTRDELIQESEENITVESVNVSNEENGSDSTVQEPVSGDTSMSFTPVNDTVTAKNVTNLRSAPSTQDPGNIVAQLLNGTSAGRIGVNQDTGWSKLEYNGQTVYAVSQYLTTDLGYKPPVEKKNPNRVSTLDGRIILFTDCDDYVTPKEYVNLRTEPSTSEGDTTVKAQLHHGENVHRTGYSQDSGWSRIEYNGEVLYVVSSYMMTVTVE